MKEILIIADGIVAKQFLERVCADLSSNNNYKVVYYNDKTVTDKKATNVKYFKFDPTSFSKLRSVFSEKIVEVFIVVKKKFDAEETYKNIRFLSKDIKIVILDNWRLKISDDNFVSLLNAGEILSSRLFDFLPNVSVIAQNVGLGIGEIMEISVPFGSPYIYRHISSIKQKNWKISAIYRANSLILPDKKEIILPNDILLVIGDPNILRGVDISIKQEIGSFPSPYGKNIYLLIDMLHLCEQDIKHLINSSLLLHSMLNNHKLIIKVINPTYSKCFEKLKSYDKGSTKVFIEYQKRDFREVFKDDMENTNIGLSVINTKAFKRYKDFLYETKIPIFKIGNYDFSKIKYSIVLPQNTFEIETLTATIFDISSQLDLDMELYDYDPENSNENEELIQHFKNLAAMFNRHLKIVNSKENPIFEIGSRRDVLHFVPFDKDVKDSSLLSLFSTNFQKLYYKLDELYQVFLPVNEEKIKG